MRVMKSQNGGFSYKTARNKTNLAYHSILVIVVISHVTIVITPFVFAEMSYLR